MRFDDTYDRFVVRGNSPYVREALSLGHLERDDNYKDRVNVADAAKANTDPFVQAEIANEIATAELQDAISERRMFNLVTTAGFAMIPTSIALTMFSFLFLFLLIGAGVLIIAGVGWRVNDNMPAKRRAEITARRNMGMALDQRFQAQIDKQLTSGEK